MKEIAHKRAYNKCPLAADVIVIENKKSCYPLAPTPYVLTLSAVTVINLGVQRKKRKL